MVQVEVIRIDFVQGDEMKNGKENGEKVTKAALVMVTTYPDGSAIGVWVGYVNGE